MISEAKQTCPECGMPYPKDEAFKYQCGSYEIMGGGVRQSEACKTIADLKAKLQSA